MEGMPGSEFTADAACAVVAKAFGGQDEGAASFDHGFVGT